jgi:glycopeptide antibiotics resistance protein
MGSDLLVVPALPVLVPLGIVLMAVSAIWLWRRGTMSVPRLAAVWLAGWYLVAILGATFLPLELELGDQPGPPSLHRLTLIPVLTVRPRDFVLNVIMTLPLAALLHIVFGIVAKRRVVLSAFLLSLVIEVTQALLVVTVNGNRWADTNDLIANTLGAYLGYLWFRDLLTYAPVRRVVDRVLIPVRRRAPAERGTPAADR